MSQSINYSSVISNESKRRHSQIFCIKGAIDRCMMIVEGRILDIILMGNQNNKSGEKGAYQELKEDLSNTCKCTLKTRIIGWIVCFAIGWILSILSSIVFIIKHDTTIFAIFYSFGQILNIAGSCFLSGPKQQAKDMFKKTRWLLTLLYVGSMIATLLLAFLLPEDWKGLVLVTLIVQMISYFLYTFSYVPFGRKILKKFCECILTID